MSLRVHKSTQQLMGSSRALSFVRTVELKVLGSVRNLCNCSVVSFQRADHLLHHLWDVGVCLRNVCNQHPPDLQISEDKRREDLTTHFVSRMNAVADGAALEELPVRGSPVSSSAFHRLRCALLAR